MNAEDISTVFDWVESNREMLIENPRPRTRLRDVVQTDLGFKVSDDCLRVALSRAGIKTSNRGSTKEMVAKLKDELSAYRGLLEWLSSVSDVTDQKLLMARVEELGLDFKIPSPLVPRSGDPGPITATMAGS